MWSLQSLFFLSLVSCLIAVCGAGFSVWRGRRMHRHRGLEKKIGELELELVELLDRTDKLTKVAKRKYARDVARKGRENGAGEPLSDDEWRRQMNLKYAQGEFKP